MKKILLLFIVISSFLIATLFSSCKKDNHKLNIILYNKDVPPIKSYIGGKWKVNFATGGISNQGQIFYNTTIEFRFQKIDSIFYFENNSVLVKSPITWKKVKFSHPDSSWVALFSSGGTPFGYGIERIQNDTLLIYDPGPDGFTYWLTRQ